MTNNLLNNFTSNQACHWSKTGDIPTHVVSSVTYGGNTHFIFEKSYENEHEKLRLHGSVQVWMTFLFVTVSFTIPFQDESQHEKHLKFSKISTYSDFHLSE